MDVIAVVECEKCGKHPLSDKKAMDVFIVDDDFLGVARCPKCKHPITVWITKEKTIEFGKKGVQIFSFLTGDKVSFNTLV